MIKLCMDKECFSSKPSKNIAGQISSRLAGQTVEMTIDEIAVQVVQPYGKTFAPAYFANGKRTNDTWLGQRYSA